MTGSENARRSSRAPHRCMRRALLLLVPAVEAFLAFGSPAFAVPSFARQTGQPCETCHVGAFGPQLTQFGRQFKLNGYVWNDGGSHVPLAAMLQASLTHTNADQPGGAAPGFAPNNNLAVDQASIFYGGAIAGNAGAFVQITYDGIGKQLTWDNADIRYAGTTQFDGKSLLLGITINNNPTVQDSWNSTPAWGFPFAASALAPAPAAATLVDGGLAQSVLGVGGYALWDDLVYAEADVYRGLGRDVRNALGTVPVSGSDSYDGAIPYWRIALEHDFGSHYLELGTFGLSTDKAPGGNNATGLTDHVTDTALDATYLYSGSPDNIVTGYLTYIRENEALDASRVLLGSNAHDTLSAFRINGSYSFQNTFTVSGQRFETSGTSDAALYGGSPNSSGWTAEIAYVPSSHAKSWFPEGINVRLSLQYNAYDEFDGTSAHASDNNTLYLLLWLAG
ncbi:MAG TPA: hypothetical protein VII49_10085 [Rhizomicrobium sp.]